MHIDLQSLRFLNIIMVYRKCLDLTDTDATQKYKEHLRGVIFDHFNQLEIVSAGDYNQESESWNYKG